MTDRGHDPNSAEEEEWSGDYDPSSDKEEKRMLFAVLDSFRQYRRTAHHNVTHRRRQSFYALPHSHWQKLAQPPFSLLDTLEKVDDAIDANADIADAILAPAVQTFAPPPSRSVDEGGGGHNQTPEWHGFATPADLGKANSTIRQFYRDWSAEGHHEREVCYQPVIEDLREQFGRLPPPDVKVLVPGAGLGRLVFDLCMAGFSAEGNEISYHQLLASSWVLNHTKHKEERVLYPFALHFSNLKSRDQQLRKVMVPDVHPGTAIEERKAAQEAGIDTLPLGAMSMSAADFLVLYGGPSQAESFDAVATVFFIDTAPNLIRYIETIHNCLKPGGLWINVGPLLWHFEDRLRPGPDGANPPDETNDAVKEFQGIGEPGGMELTEEEVFQLLQTMGFKIKKHVEPARECGYIQDPESMLQNLYRPSHWVAVKS